MIKADTVLKAAKDLNIKAAIEIPNDVKQRIEYLKEKETNSLSQFVLDKILINYEDAIKC